MQNALLTGTVVAALAGAVGYFVVLRGQSFAAHTLSQVGLPGAAAGVLLHTSPLLGLLVFCVASALGIGLAGRGLDAGRGGDSPGVRPQPPVSPRPGLPVLPALAAAGPGGCAPLFLPTPAVSC